MTATARVSKVPLERRKENGERESDEGGERERGIERKRERK